MVGTVIDAGQRIDTLSLADCHQYDPRPRRDGWHLRFRCPIHQGDHQQSLSVEETTGKFRCFNGQCEAWGTLTDHQARRDGTGWNAPRPHFATKCTSPPLPEAEPLEPNPDAVSLAKSAAAAYAGSPAQEYGRRRGIPDRLAKAHGLGFWEGEWGGVRSQWLTFPLRCPVTGRVVSVSGRNILSDDPSKKARHKDPRGIFGATQPGPMPSEVAIVEGPFEAFACLTSPDMPPVRAMMGTGGKPEWFDKCERVIILNDDDTAGAKDADRLSNALNERRKRKEKGPRILCLPPGALRKRYEAKDLGELLARGIPIALDLPPIPTTETPVLAPYLPSQAISPSHIPLDLVKLGAIVDAELEVLEHSGLLDAALEGALPVEPVQIGPGISTADPNQAAIAAAREFLRLHRAGRGNTAAANRERRMLQVLGAWWQGYPGQCSPKIVQ